MCDCLRDRVTVRVTVCVSACVCVHNVLSSGCCFVKFGFTATRTVELYSLEFTGFHCAVP